MDEVKSALRDTALRARRDMSAEERVRASASVVTRLTELPEVVTSRVALLYAALDDEVDVTPLMAMLADGGTTVLLPRVAGERLELVAEADHDRLRTGHRGVREPQGPPVTPGGLQVAVVPGVAFDPAGVRLGHGSGHYDRLLPTLPETCLRIGVCFSCQMVPRVPRASHDAAVDLVVTERAVYRTGTQVV